MPDQFPKKITNATKITFSVDNSGFYSIWVIARCNGRHDLRIEIDTLKLREIPPKDKPQYNDIPPSWNGSDLKGLAKTIIFITKLNKGSHTLKFIPSEEAIIDQYKLEPISDLRNLQFQFNMQAEDGDRRSWITLALIDLTLNEFTTELVLKRRFIDSDDIKIIVNGKIKRNDRSLLHKYWYFIASFFAGETQRETFIENLPHGNHYIEIWADRMPKINNVVLDLGDTELKRIPTVDDPAWTEDFNDDADQMILARAIFGEARDNRFPDKARIAVGWSIRNRVEDSRWKNTYQEVITQDGQYSAFNINDKNRPYVENPLWSNTNDDKIAWYNCYDIAGKVISGALNDPTNGANHYYDNSIPTPYWATKETFVLTVESSDNEHALIFHKL